MNREDLPSILPALAGLVLAAALAVSATPAAAARTSSSLLSRTTQASSSASTSKTAFEFFATLDPPRAAWTIECDGELQTQISSIELEHTWQIDLIRCLRQTRGDLLLIPHANENEFDQVDLLVLPWLEMVGGDIVVAPDDRETFDTLRLPRVHRVDGRLAIDFRGDFEGLRLPALTEVDEVDLDLRTADVDLTGLNALVEIEGALRLDLVFDSEENEDVSDTPTVRGMQGLTSVGSLSQSGYGAVDGGTDGPAFSNLTLVRGNVSVTVAELGQSAGSAPTAYQPIYATRAIETICGNVNVTDLGDHADPLVAFAALQHVAGSATWDGQPLSQLLPNVTFGGTPPACQ